MNKSIPLLSVFLTAAVGLLVGARPSVAQEASRYPYDPVCAWGRVSNGRGMLVRCLSEGEARALPAKLAAPSLPPAPSASAPPAPSGSAAPAVPVVDSQKAFSLVSIAVAADTGNLPAAAKKLALGKEKIRECLGTPGGLDKPEGGVHVRFLVSARGRAEGVSVHKRVGMSDGAATCIAHVVDRRAVGNPAATMVGATALIRVSKQKS